MKTKLLSIFSDSTEEETAAKPAAEPQPKVVSYRARYQEFLNRQYEPVYQPGYYQTTSVFRFIQGLFSVVLFVAMFLTILTLFGFGLSSLGVIAQVSPAEAAAASSQQTQPTETSPAKGSSKKKVKRH
jgi:hypothetical protein